MISRGARALPFRAPSANIILPSSIINNRHIAASSDRNGEGCCSGSKLFIGSCAEVQPEHLSAEWTSQAHICVGNE
ncbi:uncharacterized protein MYCGRDRAFT_86707 [Zymoseptoria tritici IPO323]|uniref:Uncharacterized protein n=1 Tax=Zymoseptoria tritici (strain CBS 115943 / IPO323) TaxID=336722 RepID=F9XGF7_ZYMTI|nr:uncharacterized protein MYCGRDRAFT_86707 [Zymoseptoria tritici IPO323]EGP86272.1 hypothetical protein MYCGRDRAFT_86707 [Zymoseptoria tritici IPO323]